MHSVINIVTKWCVENLSNYHFDKTELRSTTEFSRLGKVNIAIEHEHLLCSFTAWGMGTTEWIVLDLSLIHISEPTRPY